MGDLGKVKALRRAGDLAVVRGPRAEPVPDGDGAAGQAVGGRPLLGLVLTQQGPVLIEPLVKLLLPVVYFFSPGADLKCRLYFLCVLIWTVATWAVFGGAITRIAAVQVARGEKIGLVEALRFTFKRILSYLTAPLFPLLFIFVLLVVMILFGLPFMIPIFGDIFVGGLFWPVMLIVGPAHGHRPGRPGRLAAHVGHHQRRGHRQLGGGQPGLQLRLPEAVALHLVQPGGHRLRGGARVLRRLHGVADGLPGQVGRVADAGHQLRRRQPNGRKPDFLFVYAPTSFGWRPLLLKGAVVDGEKVVDADGQINADGLRQVGRPERAGLQRRRPVGVVEPAWAPLVAFWLGLVFLLILGFSYSYFWSASTIIYMLLRRNVDAAEMDEVYLEEDEGEGAFGGPLTPAAARADGGQAGRAEPDDGGRSVAAAAGAPAVPPPPPAGARRSAASGRPSAVRRRRRLREDGDGVQGRCRLEPRP